MSRHLSADICCIAPDTDHDHRQLIADAKDDIAEDEHKQEKQEVRSDQSERSQRDEDRQNKIGNLKNGFDRDLAEMQELIHPAQKACEFSSVAVAQESEVESDASDDRDNQSDDTPYSHICQTIIIIHIWIIIIHSLLLSEI